MSIRKLIEHLRIESKLLPLGIDPGYSSGIRLIHGGDENGSGRQWLPAGLRWSDGNGCDRLFCDSTCPRFCCNFIRLMAARASPGPKVRKKYAAIVSQTVIYTFLRRMMAALPAPFVVKGPRNVKRYSSFHSSFDRPSFARRFSYFLEHRGMLSTPLCLCVYLVQRAGEIFRPL